MATWTDVPDANLEPDKPWRSEDAIALKDNPQAIAEGAAGAPRVVDAALDTTVTTDGRDWVAARLAWTVPGDLGTLAMLTPIGVGSGKVYGPGTELAGSVLRYSNATTISGISPAGTWRLLGWINEISTQPSEYAASLFVRVL